MGSRAQVINTWFIVHTVSHLYIPSGATIKDVRRESGEVFGQMRTPADRRLKDLADVRKLVLFVSACFADTLFG